ncbi:hypothetical protein AKJ39_01080 [candidate division MSBL1 archaeon SCGC-AAA259J03]|uniref:Uncharacterized protein n=1 Tax=candidate division MSBL1 archaeon SCGC-AAA259J03 TaxID=1698269 RepID=A0A656YXA6_9EURY|nr:hypothetical protein AKJ39_01080 [candidate division MSBL1 archaeon SCGC-AAA259J03]
MAIYCTDCWKEFSEKPETCPSCGSERVFDTEELSEAIHEIIVEGGMREKILTLAKEKEKGLVSQEELDRVAERNVEEFKEKMEEKFPELALEDEDRD